MRFTLKTDTVTPDLKRKMEQVRRPRTLFQAGAKAIQKGIVTHLRTLQARGNEMGWPSQHFFAGGKNSVEKNVGIAKLTDSGALITIADARFAHRIKGGTVTPKRRKFLAIPLRAEAYALSGQGSLRESAPGLKLVGGGPKFFLGVEKDDRIELWFALVRKVTHRPKPNEAPDAQALERAAGAAMEKAADVLLGAVK